jgi:MoaA/NifB/PqqE/SkfB family radical SAM enzyme
MSKLENIMNKKIVRRALRYYGEKGVRRIDELFGSEKENSLGAFLGRVPLSIAINKAMKRLGVNKELQRLFFSKYFNRQTLLNVFNTLGKNGLTHPFRFDAPLVIVWNITNLCNLRCRYCYQGAGHSLKDELSFEEKIDLINQMADAHVAYLAISGGEPILADRFWDLLEYAGKFLHTSVATNGTLLGDRSLVTRLGDYGAKNVFVSLDGATAESHDFIRGGGSFVKSLKGIRNLVADEHLHVGINTVVTKRNYHEVPAILDLSAKLGVNSFSHYNFIPTGRGKDGIDQDITPGQREDLVNMLYDWHLKRHKTGLNIISTSPTYARVIYERSGGSAGLFHYTADNATSISGIIEYAGGCGAGRVYMALQPDGLASPCVFMPEVIIGDTRKQRLLEIWQSSDICLRMVDRDNFHFHCPEFQTICGGCRARAYAYGDILGPDPGCKVYQDLAEKEVEPVKIKELAEVKV